MKHNPWTLALVGAGLVSLPSITQAEEKPNAVATALSATSISGYVDTSMQWNFGGGGGSGSDLRLPPYVYGGSSKADGFNLNVVKLSIEKPIEPADQWGAGYKVDLLFGPDAASLGTTAINGVPNEFAIQQAYVALRAPVGNGLDFKVGVFNTVLGYEVFDASSNPNFTRSYGYTIEPTTQTGVLMSYQFCETFSASAGIANTIGPQINGRAFPTTYDPTGTTTQTTADKTPSYKTVTGSMTLTAPKEWGFLAGSALTGAAIWGFNPALGNEANYYMGATVNTPITNLKAGVAVDYLDVYALSGATWTIGSYLSYQATEKLSLYGRIEYMNDYGAQKVFVATADDGTGTLVTYNTAPDKTLALTGTVQYDLWKNVISRLELRWDHAMSDGCWGTPNPTTMQGNQKNELVLLANFTYKF